MFSKNSWKLAKCHGISQKYPINSRKIFYVKLILVIFKSSNSAILITLEAQNLVFYDFCPFLRLKFNKSTNCRDPNMAKKPVSALLHLQWWPKRIKRGLTLHCSTFCFYTESHRVDSVIHALAKILLMSSFTTFITVVVKKYF